MSDERIPVVARGQVTCSDEQEAQDLAARILADGGVAQVRGPTLAYLVGQIGTTQEFSLEDVAAASERNWGKLHAEWEAYKATWPPEMRRFVERESERARRLIWYGDESGEADPVLGALQAPQLPRQSIAASPASEMLAGTFRGLLADSERFNDSRPERERALADQFRTIIEGAQLTWSEPIAFAGGDHSPISAVYWKGREGAFFITVTLLEAADLVVEVWKRYHR